MKCTVAQIVQAFKKRMEGVQSVVLLLLSSSNCFAHAGRKSIIHYILMDCFLKLKEFVARLFLLPQKGEGSELRTYPEAKKRQGKLK